MPPREVDSFSYEASNGNIANFIIIVMDDLLYPMPLSMRHKPSHDQQDEMLMPEVEVGRKPKMRELKEDDLFYWPAQFFNNPNKTPSDYIPILKLFSGQEGTRFDQPMPDFWAHNNRTFFHETENGVQKNWDCLESAGYDPEELHRQAIAEDAKRNDRLKNPIGWPAWAVATKRAYNEKQRIDRACGRK